MDCPIVAIGPLGGPWHQGDTTTPGFYRIAQARNYNRYQKTIELPCWDVYCQDSVTRKVQVARVIIPDVSNDTLAEKIGANFAPNLMHAKAASISKSC